MVQAGREASNEELVHPAGAQRRGLEGGFRSPATAHVRMTAHMKFQNASATPFDLDVSREVRLLAADDFRRTVRGRGRRDRRPSGVQVVAYETANEVTNRGPAFSKDKGPGLDLDSGHDERRPAKP